MKLQQLINDLNQFPEEFKNMPVVLWAKSIQWRSEQFSEGDIVVTTNFKIVVVSYLEKE